MALHESWHVRNRSRECSITQVPFTEGQPIVTALFPDPESSGYLRKDFCLDAWAERPVTDEIPFSHWKTKFQSAPHPENQPVVTKQSAEELLKQLVEDDQEHTENTRYILAVMLERQKILRETDTQPTNTGILRIYEHRKSGEIYIVKDPNIPLDEVEKIQMEVMELLSPRKSEPEALVSDSSETFASATETAEAPSEGELL
ncbi:MAG: hypothetical protein RL346_597 [Verrucomicrobiota bacterium]